MLRRLPALLFLTTGTLHFVAPAVLRGDRPRLPARAPRARVRQRRRRGAGGVGLLFAATRRGAGWWLIATMIAVFPANVWMAQHPERYRNIPEAALWARLPLQLGIIAWIRAAMRG